MKEIHQVWLENLYKNEIKDIEGTIENEKCWMRGTNDEDEIDMYESNIENYEEYIEILKEKLEELEEKK